MVAPYQEQGRGQHETHMRIDQNLADQPFFHAFFQGDLISLMSEPKHRYSFRSQGELEDMQQLLNLMNPEDDQPRYDIWSRILYITTALAEDRTPRRQEQLQKLKSRTKIRNTSTFLRLAYLFEETNPDIIEYLQQMFAQTYTKDGTLKGGQAMMGRFVGQPTVETFLARHHVDPRLVGIEDEQPDAYAPSDRSGALAPPRGKGRARRDHQQRDNEFGNE